MTIQTDQSTAQSDILFFRSPHWPIHQPHLFSVQPLSPHMLQSAKKSKNIEVLWQICQCLIWACFPFFLYWHNIQKWPFPVCASSSLFLSHLLSLRLNYMVDRLIDTGEWKSLAGSLRTLLPTSVDHSHTYTIDTRYSSWYFADIRPRLAYIPMMDYMLHKQMHCASLLGTAIANLVKKLFPPCWWFTVAKWFDTEIISSYIYFRYILYW